MTPPNYFELYLEKSKEHKFRPDAVQEILRYLMVNGIIPVTDEHLAMMGDKEFHISAKHVPDKYKKEAEAQYLEAPTNGRYIEEHEIEWLETKEHELSGVWFKNGKMVESRVDVTRIIKVVTSYDYPPEAEPEAKPECCQGENCGKEVREEEYVKLRDGTILCLDCYKKLPAWKNPVCSECKSEYYANCPYDGHPQPHCVNSS